MQVIEKHGGASHYMRPDRVYRTSVLSPSMNFNPGQDAQAVTAEFTERSQNLSLSGPRTSGPSYVRQSGPSYARSSGPSYVPSSGPSYVPRSGPAADISCCDNCSCGGGDPCCSDWARGRTMVSSRVFAGLFGPTAKLGFMERMRLRFDAWRARFDAWRARMYPAKAQAQVQAGQAQAQAARDDRAAAFIDTGAHSATYGMAYVQVGERQAPHMMGQLRMLAHLSSSSMPKHVADAQVATSMEHWNNLRWNG